MNRPTPPHRQRVGAASAEPQSRNRRHGIRAIERMTSREKLLEIEIISWHPRGMADNPENILN